MTATRTVSVLLIGTLVAATALTAVALATSSTGMWGMAGGHGGMMGAGMMGGGQMMGGGMMGGGSMMSFEECQSAMSDGGTGAVQCPHHAEMTRDPAQCQAMMG